MATTLSKIRDISNNLLSYCESKVPDFVNPPPPNRDDMLLRSKPGDKIENIQTHIIGDWLVNPLSHPFQFHIRDITPDVVDQRRKVYLIWAFRVHDDVQLPITNIQYKQQIRQVVQALNEVKGKTSEDDWDIEAVKNAYDVFSGASLLNEYASVLYLQQDEDVSLLSAAYGHKKTVSAYINYVGNTLVHTKQTNMKSIYGEYVKNQPDKFPGPCQQNMTLLMLYLKDQLNIELVNLYNAAAIGGCICYLRAAESAGYLTYKSSYERVPDSIFEIFNNNELDGMFAKVQGNIVNHYSCTGGGKIGGQYEFITPRMLKEMVKMCICVHHNGFIEIGKDLVIRQDWVRLKIIDAMVTLPLSVNKALTDVFNSKIIIGRNTYCDDIYPTCLKNACRIRMQSMEFTPSNVQKNQPPYKKSKMSIEVL